MKYNSSSIEIVQNVSHIRKRPNMYIQNTRKEGMHQLVKECLDNSVDEWLGGNADRVKIVLDTKEQVISIADNGRGIPVEYHRKAKMSTLTAVFTLIGAGGKFSDKAYNISSGLHGVGVTIVNALSDFLVVEVFREGYRYSQQFEKGKAVTDVKKGKPSRKQGTRITFQPDPELFTSKFDPEVIRGWLKNLSYLCPKLQLIFEVNGEEEEYCSHRGLQQLLTDLIHDKHEPMGKPFVYSNPALDVSLIWTTTQYETEASYVNCSFTREGGTHRNGLKKIILAVLQKRSKKNLVGEDVRVGLFAALHVKVKNPEFKGQTKDRILNSELEKVVYDSLETPLTRFFDKNKALANAIIDRALSLCAAREEYKKKKAALKNIKIVNKKTRGVLPGKLAEAPHCKPENRELFICEGDSAAGYVKKGRDKTFQECLPIRGNILNTAQKDMNAALNNAEIQNIITAIGCNVGEFCDPKKARVGRVMIFTDADEDGAHIASLLVTFFNKHMRPFVDEGRVYMVRSPLFVSAVGDKRWYAFTLEELQEKMGKLYNRGTITRLKGQGSANVEDIRQYALDSMTRKLYQFSTSDKDVRYIQRLMGLDSSLRKKVLGII